MSSQRHFLETKRTQKCDSISCQHSSLSKLEGLGNDSLDEGINKRHLGSVLAVILRCGGRGEKGEAKKRAQNKCRPTVYKAHSTSGGYFSVFLGSLHPLIARCVPQHATPGGFRRNWAQPHHAGSRRPAGLWFTSPRWDSQLIKPQQGLFQKHQHHFCFFNTFQLWKGWCQHYDYPGTSSASWEPGQHPAPLSGRCSGQLSVLLASSLSLYSTDRFRACFSQSSRVCLNQDSWAWLAGGGHRREKVEPLPRSVWQDLGE